jgi:UDP-2,4-diacetamido-2,4,6-trideoxy-beta-L-altropyranose hydrolase
VNVVFRADASLQMGTGHVMRCMTLARALRQRGTTVSFVSRDIPGHLCDFVEDEGFAVCRLPYDGAMAMAMPERSDYARWLQTTPLQDAFDTGVAITASNLRVDWLVVDHYALDWSWERAMRPFTRNIMVIDDLADRHHDCEMLLDQNLYEDINTRYDGRIPPHAVKLLGPEFALLRPEFSDLRRHVRARKGEIRKILILFGGCDLSNETSKAIEAVALNRRAEIMADVVIGANNPNRDAIEAAAARLPSVKCHFNVSNMAKLMNEADVCIGAAGGTTWERCCLGLPAMVVAVADNQVAATRWLHENGILYFIGEHSSVSVEDIAEAIDLFCGKPDLARRYSENSMSLVDGMGVQKCVDIILNTGLTRKSETIGDGDGEAL